MSTTGSRAGSPFEWDFELKDTVDGRTAVPGEVFSTLLSSGARTREDFREWIERSDFKNLIFELKRHESQGWGRMTPFDRLQHCDTILEFVHKWIQGFWPEWFNYDKYTLCVGGAYACKVGIEAIIDMKDPETSAVSIVDIQRYVGWAIWIDEIAHNYQSGTGELDPGKYPVLSARVVRILIENFLGNTIKLAEENRLWERTVLGLLENSSQKHLSEYRKYRFWLHFEVIRFSVRKMDKDCKSQSFSQAYAIAIDIERFTHSLRDIAHDWITSDSMGLGSHEALWDHIADFLTVFKQLKAACISHLRVGIRKEIEDEIQQGGRNPGSALWRHVNARTAQEQPEHRRR